MGILISAFLKVLHYICSSIPIICILLPYIFFRKKPKLFILITIACFVIIAVNYSPLPTDDLSRVFERLGLVRTLGWNGLINQYVDSTYFEGAKLYYVLLWFYSFFPDWFMPACNTFLIYSLIGHLIHCAVIDFSAAPQDESDWIMLTFTAINFYSAVSSFRYMLTLALLANILYLDLVRKRKRLLCIVLYVGLGFFHTIAFTILGFRILAMFLRSYGKWIAVTVVLTWRMFLPILTSILQSFTNSVVATELMVRINVYTETQESSQLFYHIVLLLFDFAVGVLWFSTRKNNGSENKKYEQLDTMTVCILTFAVSCIGQLNFVFRYTHYLMIFAPVYLARLKCGRKQSTSWNKVTLPEFICLIAVIALISFYVVNQYPYIMNQY